MPHARSVVRHVELMGIASLSPGAKPEADYWPGARAYLREGNNAARLRGSQGLGIGLVDGDMAILWPEAKT